MDILFVTTTNLTANPRLRKEVALARTANYSVKVIAFRLGIWSDALDADWLAENPVPVQYLEASRKGFLPWLVATSVERFSQLLPAPVRRISLKLTAYANTRRAYQILQALEQQKELPKLLIGHNLGTLFPIYSYAKRQNVPFAFDVEDYHPGETITISPVEEKSRREKLMRELLPAARYYSFASPIIGEAVKKLLKQEVVGQDRLLVNNCFSNQEFTKPKAVSSEKVQFVWFSQHISAGRGLELVVPVLAHFRDKVQLTLIGNTSPSYAEGFLKPYSDFITFHEPLPQAVLHHQLAEFDIGLAIDLSSADYNRQIALTNKIISCYQAGLFIFATDTPAQQLFIQKHVSSGITVAQEPKAVAKGVEDVLKEIQLIRQDKPERFERAKVLSWENEQQKLLASWKKILG